MMGYILPMEPYQQMNYQLRDVQPKRNVELVEKPYRIILNRQYKELENGAQWKKVPDPDVPVREARDKQIAAIIGKGILVDKMI